MALPEKGCSSTVIIKILCFFRINRLKLIDKIAGKMRKGQTIFKLRFPIADFEAKRPWH